MARFVQPIRTSLGLITSRSVQLYSFRIPSALGNTIPINYSHYAKWKSVFHNFCDSGGIYAMGGMVSLSAAVTSLRHNSCVAHCSDDFGVLADDLKSNWTSASESDRERHAVLAVLRRYLVPLFFLLTIVLNWGHPIIVVAKVALVLLSTKPSPSSIYVFVEEMRHQALHKHPLLYSFKSLYTKEVEVEDYTLLCLASVGLGDMRYTLIGVLGSWWVLPVSSWKEAQTMLTNSIRKHLE